MTKYTAVDFAKEVLEKATDVPLSAGEIWEKGQSLGFDKKLSLTGRLPYATFSAYLYVAAESVRSPFIKIGKRPTKFWLRSRDLISNVSGQAENSTTETGPDVSGYTEWELHPLLTYFAYSNVRFNKEDTIYTKTIYHGMAVAGQTGEWRFPDMVGVYIPVVDWKDEVIELNKITNLNPVTLYSFEMRKAISYKNCRPYFFQAVSNSSWANEGYLVAANIDTDVIDELGHLSELFGIGVIKLELTDIDTSFVMYPAKRRQNLDWDTVNQLAIQNEEFNKFIRNVKQTYDIKTFHEEDYDDILSPDDVPAYVRKHRMLPPPDKLRNLDNTSSGA